MRHTPTKKLHQHHVASTQSRTHRRVVLYLVVIAFTSVCALFLAYANSQQLREARAVANSQQKTFAALDKQLAETLARRVAEAKKAEAAAKAKADEDSALRAQQSTANPSGTLATATCSTQSPDSITVVINKRHCFSPLEWAPPDLTSFNGFLLRSEAAAQLRAMTDAASLAGMSFEPSSAYRSYANQVVTYNNWVAVNGSQAAADTVSARPGYSEHQTGLAIDLKAGGCTLECFGSTAQYQWLLAHASDYGFIERYPSGLTSITGYSPEAWHWRYVGTATAKDMKQKGIQTLEQYLGIAGGDYAQ